MALILALLLHEDFSLDCTNFSHFTAVPVPGTNNQRQLIVCVESTIHTLPYHPAHPQHIDLEFVDIDQGQCLLVAN